MKQRTLIALLTTLAALAPASAAHAGITELGPLGTATASCPGFAADDCSILVVRQTGFQAKVGTAKAFTTMKTSGSVVAWTVSLADVAASKVKGVSDRYGGSPRAALVILAPLGKSQFQVVQKGPLIDLTKYLGTIPTFALPTALPIKAGQVVGITVPTWAPILQLGLGSDTSWRSSKPPKETIAKDYRPQRALVGDTTMGSFAALYQRTRLAYSATVVPTPAVAKTTPAAKTPTKTTPTKSTP